MHTIETNKLYNEDCLVTLKDVPNGLFDLIVTSPPYGYDTGLRVYDGTPWTLETFKKIAEEIYRTTKPGGIVCWVVGDQTINGSESGDSFRQALYFMECGFRLHDTMIYIRNGVRNPSTNRYHQCFEYMFILSKGSPKTINLIKDRKNIYPGKRTKRQKAVRTTDGKLVPDREFTVGEYGTRWNYWIYDAGKGHSAKDSIAYRHPAIMSEDLTKDLIVSFSNSGEVVYDPFGGSGTTGIVALENGRNFILSEISKEYCEIIKERFKERFRIDV